LKAVNRGAGRAFSSRAWQHRQVRGSTVVTSSARKPASAAAEEKCREKMFWRLTLLAAFLGTALAVGSQSALAQPIGKARERAPRGTTHSVHWDGITLGEALERIRRTGEASVFLDRRIDSSQRVQLSIENATLAEIVAQLAAPCGAGMCRIGEVFYVGPEESAERLASLAALRRRDASRLPPELRTPLAARKSIAWPRLTEPRGLVAQLAAQHGLRILNAERIPFDVWPAGKLPRLALADQLTLLLVGFDLTYRFTPGNNSLEIVPIEWDAITPRADARPPQTAEKPRAETRQVYTLRVQEQPVGAVLTQLAKRLGWKLDVDEAALRAAGRSMDTRVSFAVEDADADQLLDAVLGPAELKAARNGDRVTIKPR
jgi:hypothetical protein